MRPVELDRLEALTRDYAAFQARKSGLATALGGMTVCLMFWVVLMPRVFQVDALSWPALEGFLLMPFLWLVIKSLVARLLYRGLGTVKAQADPPYERRLARWTFGLCLFLMAFQGVALYGFVGGTLAAGNPGGSALNPGQPAFHHWAHPWPWLIWLPLAYLVPVPWVIRGVEEARAYAVMVGQCMFWLVPIFLFAFGTAPRGPLVPKGMVAALATAYVILPLVLLAWAALAIVRGWTEHRQYLALLRSLPRPT